MRSVEPKLALAAAFALLTATPAAADDGRRHVMTPTQKIDLVRDLPNDETFERDGAYFDLGYIYPVHTVNGASVASAGGEAGFVLYHDDRYAKLDASDIQTVTMALGEDPTEGYTPPVPASASRASAADPWGADGSPDSARGQPISSPPPVRRRSFGQGWIAIFVAFMLFALIRWGRNMLFRGVFNLVSGSGKRSSSAYTDHPQGSANSDPFEARVAARLAELHNGGAPAQPAAYDPGAIPAARGFGRKGA